MYLNSFQDWAGFAVNSYVVNSTSRLYHDVDCIATINRTTLDVGSCVRISDLRWRGIEESLRRALAFRPEGRSGW